MIRVNDIVGLIALGDAPGNRFKVIAIDMQGELVTIKRVGHKSTDEIHYSKINGGGWGGYPRKS